MWCCHFREIRPRRRTNRILNRRTAGQSRRGWMVPAAVTRVNASNRAPPRRRHLKHGYRDNRRGHYYKHDRVLICAHVGTGALRAGNPVKIGKDGGKINPSVNSSAS